MTHPNNTLSWRHEWKFAIPDGNPLQIASMLVGHPAAFHTTYPQREIRNIYFDTPELDTYRANLDGIGLRRKYRLRWYGDSWGQSPNARWETKIKDNQLGRKAVINAETPLAWTIFAENDFTRPPSWPSELRPSLINAYQRAYYLSFDQQIRLTLDWGQQFWQFPKQAHHQTPPPDAHWPVCVIELKFDEPQLARARDIAQGLPFTRSKHSKYGVGVELLTN